MCFLIIIISFIFFDICERFKNLWTNFTYESSNGNYKFTNDKDFKDYCNNNCDDNLGKINAGCLYLFDGFFGKSSMVESVEKSKITIVEYIMIWLSYMLSLIRNEGNNISNLSHFYTVYINGSEHYKKSINGTKDNTSYMDLLNKKKYFLGMDKNIISDFYEAFKLLCEMYTGFDENKQDCTKHLENAQKFVNKCKELNEKPSISNNSSYKQLLLILSTDYDNLKNKCSDSSSIPEIKTIISALTSVDTSSSSIGKKSFIVLSIFGAIAIFLGISYKVNNKELKKNYYIYVNFNKSIVHSLTFYISIRYLDFGNDFKNKN
ncbi:putative yir3 protein [Plasmodium yoelii yoelii]|uniref:Yir3 protein n=1 Tax=Plasmodium yoelii yoelii TaxID=73239 RepID=Q7RKA4_PLAYO|nr:putative yir3 protein [Plasmodium yoelii yoelii]